MANANAPFGLEFIGFKGAGQGAPLITRRNAILSTNSEAIFTGDLVRQSADGYWYQWDASTIASLCVGVFVGCEYASAVEQTMRFSKYWPGSGAVAGTIQARIIPARLAPSALFRIQTDATGITVADIGANGDITVGTGSTTSGKSASVLNATSTLNTTNSLPLAIEDLWANWVMGNQPTGAGGSSSLVPGTQAGAYNHAVVSINNFGVTGV